MRGQIEIMTEILELCMIPRTQTGIRSKTSLSHAQVKTYIALLTSRGLLEIDLGKYATTLRGRSFLGAAAQLSHALEDFTRTISKEAALRLERKGSSNNGVTTAFFTAGK